MHSSYNGSISVQDSRSTIGSMYKLEASFRALFNNKLHCLSVMNATSGLMALLDSLPKGKVLVPLFTSPATYAAIYHAGHEVVFCDIDPISLCLSPDAVKGHLNSSVSAVVSVNIFGHMGHLSELRELTDDSNTLLILDAAQSLATCVLDPERTCLADAVVFSLGPNKWLSCPDGGIVAVQSSRLWEQLISKTQHTYRQILDIPQLESNYEHFNFRINPYTAALAVSGLENIHTDISSSLLEQKQLVAQITCSKLFEPLLNSSKQLLETLTAIPTAPGMTLTGMYDLPIPTRKKLASDLDLPETLRHFRSRKSIDPTYFTSPPKVGLEETKK